MLCIIRLYGVSAQLHELTPPSRVSQLRVGVRVFAEDRGTLSLAEASEMAAMLLAAAVAAAAPAASPSGCSLDSTCLTGVASTIGYFENNPHAPKSMSCSEMWSEAVSSNCGPQ